MIPAHGGQKVLIILRRFFSFGFSGASMAQCFAKNSSDKIGLGMVWTNERFTLLIFLSDFFVRTLDLVFFFGHSAPPV